MGNKIRVSLDRMGNDQGRIVEQLKRTQREVEKLRDAMQKLSSCWEGPAWSSFQSTVADDIEYMRGLYQELNIYINNINESRNKYMHSEKNNYNVINGIWI